VLCLVAARGADGSMIVLADLLATTWLATGLRDGGLLDPAARARTRMAVAAFAQRARELGARPVVALGTAAMRAAADGLVAYDRERVHGHGLATERLLGLALSAPTGGVLDDDRRQILPAGAVVLEVVARAAGAARVVVSDHGIRHARARALLAAELP